MTETVTLSISMITGQVVDLVMPDLATAHTQRAALTAGMVQGDRMAWTWGQGGETTTVMAQHIVSLQVLIKDIDQDAVCRSTGLAEGQTDGRTPTP